MKYSAVLAALAGLSAAKPQVTEPPNSTVTGRPGMTGAPACVEGAKAPDDPFIQFPVGKTAMPCDAYHAVAFGPAPTGCAKFEVIAARGTYEPGPYGSVIGDPVVARVLRDLKGEDARGYAVQYPADATRDSGRLGWEDAVKRIQTKSVECPDIKFAMVGYSQGGGVTVNTMNNLPPEYHDRIVAVVLYGAGNGTNIKDADLKQKTLSNCAPGDCGTPRPADAITFPHFSYNDEGTVWHERTTDYIVSAFQGKSLGPKTLNTPTGEL